MVAPLLVSAARLGLPLAALRMVSGGRAVAGARGAVAVSRGSRLGGLLSGTGAAVGGALSAVGRVAGGLLGMGGSNSESDGSSDGGISSVPDEAMEGQTASIDGRAGGNNGAASSNMAGVGAFGDTEVPSSGGENCCNKVVNRLIEIKQVLQIMKGQNAMLMDINRGILDHMTLVQRQQETSAKEAEVEGARGGRGYEPAYRESYGRGRSGWNTPAAGIGALGTVALMQHFFGDREGEGEGEEDQYDSESGIYNGPDDRAPLSGVRNTGRRVLTSLRRWGAGVLDSWGLPGGADLIEDEDDPLSDDSIADPVHQENATLRRMQEGYQNSYQGFFESDDDYNARLEEMRADIDAQEERVNRITNATNILSVRRQVREDTDFSGLSDEEIELEVQRRAENRIVGRPDEPHEYRQGQDAERVRPEAANTAPADLVSNTAMDGAADSPVLSSEVIMPESLLTDARIEHIENAATELKSAADVLVDASTRLATAASSMSNKESSSYVPNRMDAPALQQSLILPFPK